MRNLPKITSVFLNVTDCCCCCCRYCFVSQKPNFMSYKVAKDTADFLIQNVDGTKETPSINFFGGEPTLCWDSIIVPLTKYLREEYNKLFKLSMTSNCVFLDNDRIQFMKDNDIGLLFSIDGDKETQDYNRPMHNGESSFDKLKDKIDIIAKEFPGCTFRSTLIPHTVHNTFHNIMFAVEHGYKSFFITPNVFEEWDSKSRETLRTELRKYSDWIIFNFRNGNIPSIDFSEYKKSFRKIQKINTAITNDMFREEKSCGACAKCGLGHSRFAAVDYKGNLYSCQELVSPKEGEKSIFYIGNIYSGIDDKKRNDLIDSFNTTEDRTGNCKHCRLNRICNGGCVANNQMQTGSINKTPEMWCWWENALLDESIYIMNVLGNEKNETFTKYWRSCLNGK